MNAGYSMSRACLDQNDDAPDIIHCMKKIKKIDAALAQKCCEDSRASVPRPYRGTGQPTDRSIRPPSLKIQLVIQFKTPYYMLAAGQET